MKSIWGAYKSHRLSNHIRILWCICCLGKKFWPRQRWKQPIKVFRLAKSDFASTSPAQLPWDYYEFSNKLFASDSQMLSAQIWPELKRCGRSNSNNKKKRVSLRICSDAGRMREKSLLVEQKLKKKKYDTNGIRWGLAWTNFNTSRD